jgi:hypothetical protein
MPPCPDLVAVVDLASLTRLNEILFYSSGYLCMNNDNLQ